MSATNQISLVIDGIPEARPYLGNRVMPLSGICEPLVADMQKVIKRQNEVLEQCYHAIDYLLSRNNPNHDKLLHILNGTQAADNLVNAVSALTGEDRKTVCGAYGLFYTGEA